MKFATLSGTLLLVALGSASAEAQQWATKMFKVHKHDFGAVARGSKQEFRFELQNSYEEDVHIASVRSSCGCTSPRISKQNLKTWEKCSIIATYNTRSFLGHKSATLTVTIDRPYYAEVQLNVSGFIRGDVVFEPGSVNFGEIEAGEKSEKSVRVTYAGRANWRIKDVRSTNKDFEVRLKEVQRVGGRVAYDMIVRLKGTGSAGFFADQLTLVTDDANNGRIPLPVEGKIIPAVTVYPQLLSFVVKPGASKKKQIVVRGKKPFKIVKVGCGDGCFKFTASSDSKKVHVIPVVFTGGESAEIDEQIKIETDFGDGVTVSCRATARVE